MVVLTIGAGISARHGHEIVFQGYVPANGECGYGYDLLRLNEENLFGWRTSQPVQVILWKAKKTPVFGECFEIDGHHVRTSGYPGGRALALQPDYTAKPIPLSNREANRLFAFVEQAAKDNRLVPDDFWLARIEPELRLVGPGQAEHAPAAAPAHVPTVAE